MAASTSPSSSWGQRLDKKLRGLADSASKETIQTIATWIGFNRKHASVIGKVFCDCLKGTGSNPTRQWLYWQIIHELLLSKHTEPAKWDKFLDLRTSIGDAAVVPAIQDLGSKVVVSNLEPLLKEWDEHNVFGGPTMVSQIRRMLLSASKTNEEPVQPSSPPKNPATEMVTETTATAAAAVSEATPTKTPTTTKSTPSETPAAAVQPKNDSATAEAKPAETTTKVLTEKTKKNAPKESKPAAAEGTSHKRRLSLSDLQDVEYDFESKNVPKGKVDSREFLDPCKAIATLQIARDLRNDTAVQLSSLLSTLPKDIQEVCEKRNAATPNNPPEELDKATIHDYSMRIPSKILDLDLEEQTQTIQTFRELIRQQMTAREQLIYLLLKSRCHFGSEPAAQAFLEFQETAKKLQRRKELLGDALELEGLDSELDTTDYEKEINELPPLTWYINKDKEDSQNSSTSQPDAKKPKIS